MARAPSPRSEAARRGEAGSRAAYADGPSARPPWLEEADEDEEAASTLIGRRTFWALVIGLVGLIGGVALGVWLIGRQTEAPIDMPAAGAEVPLVRNPGPWKIAPTGPGIEGKLVEGQDQEVHGTGGGTDDNSRIATDAVAEEPGLRPGTTLTEPGIPPGASLAEPGLQPGAIAAPTTGDADTLALQPAPPPAPKPAPPKPATSATIVVPRAAPKPTPAPAAAPASPAEAAPTNGSASASDAGSTVQLGAFSSEGRAREAWKGLSGRYSYLATFTPVILPTARDGKTLYRLRATTSGPAEARDICGRLRVAGDSCTVVE